MRSLLSKHAVSRGRARTRRTLISSTVARGVRVAVLVLSGLVLAPIGAVAGSITLAWDPSPDSVAGYTIYYGTSPGSYTASVDTSLTSYTIQGLAAGVRYYFVVRAYSASGDYSAASNEVSGVVAAALVFTDDPLLPGVHGMRTEHITELRARINLLRVARSLEPVVVWTDTTLLPGSTLVKAGHIMELWSALDQVYISINGSAPSRTAITAGMPIRAVDITSLRDAVKALE